MSRSPSPGTVEAAVLPSAPPTRNATTCTGRSSCSVVRVGTWNVHQFTNQHSEDKFEDICNVLLKADLDIIGLQETTGFLLKELVTYLNNNSREQQNYTLMAKYGGTALITRLKVIPGSNTKPGKGRYCSGYVHLPVSSATT